ncbi:MAG: PQQ-dependent sugar dehydrogenase [Deltaproteobacteria bacterium]|nr:PQQ-dependent sugar dehydrogenase [Deltaproteobacteria bacterium]
MRRIALAFGVLATGPTVARAETLASGITDLQLGSFVSGLNQPTAAEFLPDGRLVIIQKEGAIRVRPAAGGALINAGTVPVETTSEQGLIGLAIDPQFATSNRIYFYYSAEGTAVTNRNRVAYATMDPATSLVDVAGRHDILTGIYGPANHDGGGLRFGPDGYLYIGAGDTGCNCGCAPGQADNYFGTCLTNYNGKIMKVDRDGNPPPNATLSGVQTAACGLPAGNYCSTGPNVVPNASNLEPARAAIYNWGFRNPWRFVFDDRTNYLWIGDVGEVTWEEITISTGPDQHHGWPFREGVHGQARTTCASSTPQSGDCKEPAYEYNHSENPQAGQGSVTAGAFSNHCSWPAPWNGRFWFADYNKGRVWTLTPNAARDGIEANSRATVVTGASGPVHFLSGPDHGIYFVAIGGGDIWRIAPTSPVVCDADGGIQPDAAQLDAAAPVDSGADNPDAVGPSPDSGAAADAALPAEDTGVAIPDSGVMPPDAGQGSDAAVGVDSGVAEEDDSCSCAATKEQSTFGALSALFAILALRFRRRLR